METVDVTIALWNLALCAGALLALRIARARGRGLVGLFGIVLVALGAALIGALGLAGVGTRGAYGVGGFLLLAGVVVMGAAHVAEIVRGVPRDPKNAPG